MKHSTITKTFTIAAVTALALGLGPTAKADNKGCSTATLTGTFAITTTGVFVAAPAALGPYAAAGTQTFDGKGGTIVTGMANTNGNVTLVANTGTYTVNPDCTGTFTIPIKPGIASQWFFVLAINGNSSEFQAVCLDPVAVITRIGRSQFPAGDWRQ